MERWSVGGHSSTQACHQGSGILCVTALQAPAAPCPLLVPMDMETDVKVKEDVSGAFSEGVGFSSLPHLSSPAPSTHR